MSATILVTACSGSTEPADSSPTAVFDQVWSDYDRNYAFFDLGNIDWNAYRSIYRDSVAAATTDARVGQLIGGMLGRLNDYHADLTTPIGVFGAPPISYPHHFSPTIVRLNYATEPMRLTSSQHIAYAHLKNSVGYVHISTFVGDGWGSEFDGALAAIGDSHAIIVDIRDNPGGSEDIGRVIAAHFYDRTRVYRKSRFRDGPNHGDFTSWSSMDLSPAGRKYNGRVALITNRFNGSAAEDFTLMMRILPTVTQVGDTTLGLGSNPLERTLGNGWKYRIPRSMQSTPDGFVYQWKGLPPALAVRWDDDATASGRDPYIDAAMENLNNG
jgi:C-terminal processing protease CtpA/Prc